MNKQLILWFGLVMLPLLTLTALLKNTGEIDSRIVSDLVHNKKALYAFERANLNH